MSGKIVAVVGGPRSGKSFLVDLLSRHYSGIPLLEGETTQFPQRIQESIEKNVRPLERICWFRNKQMTDFLKAKQLKDAGKLVFTDNFWVSYQLYIDALSKGFERDVIHQMAELDRRLMVWPDLVVLLTLSKEGIQKFIRLGGRDFDNHEGFIREQAIPVQDLHLKFFSRVSSDKKVVIFDRDNLDFKKKSHLARLVAVLDEHL